MSVELAFDTRLFQPSSPEDSFFQSKITTNLSGYLIEHKLGQLEDRINTLHLSVGEDGLVDPSTGKRLRDSLRCKTRYDKLEYLGVLDLDRWSVSDESEVCIWISPPKLESNEPESRFTICEKVQCGNQTMVVLRGICGHYTDIECVHFAESISQKGQLFHPDALRTIVFPLLPGKNQDWVSYLESIIGSSPIWQKIRNGDDYKRREEAQLVAQEIALQFTPMLLNAKDSWEFIEIGKLMEKAAASKGFFIQCEGSCGISNSLAYSAMASMEAVSRGVFVSKVTCRKCGDKFVPGSPACPGCGMTKREFDMSIA